MSSKFNFDEVKGNLQQINISYTSFGENTDFGNQSIADYINNGVSSAVNSPIVGTWFASTWAANTSSAGDFQRNFNEWSQAVTNIMTKTGNMDEEANALYLPKLMFGKEYYLNKSAYSGNSALLMTRAERAYRAFLKNPTNITGLSGFLDSSPEAASYLYDRVKSDVEKKLAEAEKIFMIGNKRKSNSQGWPQIELTGLNGIQKEMADYYNKNGVFPELKDMNTLTSEGIKTLDRTKNGRIEVQ